MRPTCTYCARKHLAQALILMQEALQGYPEHRWLAIGHMAEASDELIKTYPAMADRIRSHRKAYELEPTKHVDIMDLITEVGKLGATSPTEARPRQYHPVTADGKGHDFSRPVTAEDPYPPRPSGYQFRSVEEHAQRAAEGLPPSAPVYPPNDPTSYQGAPPDRERQGRKPFVSKQVPTPPHPDFKELRLQCDHYYGGGAHRFSSFRHQEWNVTMDRSETFFLIEKTIEGRYWKIRVNQNDVQQPVAPPEPTHRTADGFILEPWSKARIEGTYPPTQDDLVAAGHGAEPAILGEADLAAMVPTPPGGPEVRTASNLYAAANQVVPSVEHVSEAGARFLPKLPDGWPTYQTVMARFWHLNPAERENTFVVVHGFRAIRLTAPQQPFTVFGVTLGSEGRIYDRAEPPSDDGTYHKGGWGERPWDTWGKHVPLTPQLNRAVDTYPGADIHLDTQGRATTNPVGPVVGTVLISSEDVPVPDMDLSRPVDWTTIGKDVPADSDAELRADGLGPYLDSEHYRMPADRPSSAALHAAYRSALDPVVPKDLVAALPTPTGDCPPCIKAYDDQVYALLTNALNDGRVYKNNVIILTTLSNFHPSYSLVSVILEQAHALALAGRRVLLIVHRACDVAQLPSLPPEIILCPLLPVVAWHPDEIRGEQVVQFERFFHRLVDALPRTFGAGGPKEGWPVADIITHDVMFQAAYVTLAKAVHVLNTPERDFRRYVRWFHMAHSSVGERSMTTGGSPTEVFPVFYRQTLPPGHHLLVLNHADRRHFQEYYRWGYASKPLDVVPVPENHIHTLLNPRDIRPFLRMTNQAAWLTTRYGLHLADVTVMFPVSMTRIRDKRLHLVIQMLGALKRMGLTVRLLIPTAHANGDGFVTGVAYVREHALNEGLIMAEDDTPKPMTGVPAMDLPLTTEDRDRAAHDAAFVDRPEGVASDPGPEVILTCSVLPDTRAHGLDADTIRSLWGVTSVFMLPSISEAGSLILLEAALAGCVLVLNQSLPALHDYVPLDKAIWIPWGSIKGPGEELTPEHVAQYAEGIWSQACTTGPGSLRRTIMQKHCLESYAVALTEILDLKAEA